MKSFLIAILGLMVISAFAQQPCLKPLQPASVKTWNLVWHDEFRASNSIENCWIPENAAPSHILSSRWSENVSIKKGKLMLLNNKKQRAGKEWTTGSVRCSKTFKYGYFECKMKISKASGLNNAFWFYQWNPTEGHAFEIDVVEAHYPNWMQTNIHDRGTKESKYLKQNAKIIHLKTKNLYDKYHIYGLNWQKDKIEFYVDGVLVRTEKNLFCYDYANIALSTAVMKWGGNITNKIDGTAMVVDYVRVYK